MEFAAWVVLAAVGMFVSLALNSYTFSLSSSHSVSRRLYATGLFYALTTFVLILGGITHSITVWNMTNLVGIGVGTMVGFVLGIFPGEMVFVFLLEKNSRNLPKVQD